MFGLGRAGHARAITTTPPPSVAPLHPSTHPVAARTRAISATAAPPAPGAPRWSLVPGARGVAAHVPAPAPPLAFEWDFERMADLGADAAHGPLSGWSVRSGDPGFARTCGRLNPSRLPHGHDLVDAIGGDYWERSYWPGNSGDCLLDTAGARVTVVSPPFTLGPTNRHLSFLVGGGEAGGSVWLEVAGAPPGPEAAPFVDRGPGSLGMVRRDHAVPDTLFGRVARLVVEGRGGQGILVDDFAGSGEELAWHQPDGPVWGIVNLHNHVFNHLTYGGRLIAGRVTEKPLSADLQAGLRTGPGVAHALEDCEVHHGVVVDDASEHTLSLTPEFCHARGGYPTFDGWPKATTTVHQQVYVDWLKRAWRGGLRLMHLDVGNNAFSGQIFGEANFWLRGNVFPLDDTAAVERTLGAIREFVAGEGRGWAEIAYSSADARRIVGAGKLALVLGIEVDALGDYFTECPKDDHRLFSQLQKRPCRTLPADPATAEATVRDLVDRLYAMGVTHLIPIHVIENAYGYPATYGRAFDVNSEWANGRGYDLVNGWDAHVRFRLDDDAVDNVPLLTWAISVLGDVRSQFHPWRLQGGPFPDGRIGHMAEGGLKRPGEVLVDAMMKHAMMVDLQHMGERATDRTIEMARRADYPLVLTHTGFRELSFGYSADVGWDPKRPRSVVEAYDTAQVERIANDAEKSRAQVEAIRELGGMVGVGLTTSGVATSWGRTSDDFCDDTSVTWMSSYDYASELLGGRGIGFGSDANGLATLPKPRFGTDACLGANGDDFRAPLMGAMAARQRNGVRYDDAPGRMGVTDAGAGRFENSGSGYAYTDAERAVWEGLAEAEVTRQEPDVRAAFRRIGAYDQRAFLRVPRAGGLVRRYAKGFWAKQHGAGADVLDACEDSCDDLDNCSQLCPEKTYSSKRRTTRSRRPPIAPNRRSSLSSRRSSTRGFGCRAPTNPFTSMRCTANEAGASRSIATST